MFYNWSWHLSNSGGWQNLESTTRAWVKETARCVLEEEGPISVKHYTKGGVAVTPTPEEIDNHHLVACGSSYTEIQEKNRMCDTWEVLQQQNLKLLYTDPPKALARSTRCLLTSNLSKVDPVGSTSGILRILVQTQQATQGQSLFRVPHCLWCGCSPAQATQLTPSHHSCDSISQGVHIGVPQCDKPGHQRNPSLWLFRGSCS